MDNRAELLHEGAFFLSSFLPADDGLLTRTAPNKLQTVSTPALISTSVFQFIF